PPKKSAPAPPWIDFHGAALDLKVVSLSIRALLEEPLPSLLFSASSAPLRFALPFGSGARTIRRD
ncbi:MAG: hypothetical protein WB630_19560, partial [Candidatus Acidiferrales bacterium]